MMNGTPVPLAKPIRAEPEEEESTEEEQESEEERDWGHKLGRSFAGLHDTEEQEASYGRNDVGEGHDNGNQAGGYHLVKLCCLHGIVGRVNEEAGHEKEHGHDIFVIGLEGLPNTGAIYLFLIRSFLRCAQLLVGQEDGAENHRDEPEKIDQEASTPVDGGQHSGEQGGKYAAGLVHG